MRGLRLLKRGEKNEDKGRLENESESECWKNKNKWIKRRDGYVCVVVWVK